jgi:Arc/MetJ family transcription regulator
MKNITLAIDDDVLAKVRRIAVEKNTTVNALVREYLAHLAGREDRVRQAMAELDRMTHNSSVEVGKITWKRDDLHER